MEITLRQPNYLSRLQEKASFSAAAQTLLITQPAHSVAISQLEEVLGVSPVERGTRLVTFNGFGDLLLATAHRFLREIKQVRDEISSLESGKIMHRLTCPLNEGETVIDYWKGSPDAAA